MNKWIKKGFVAGLVLCFAPVLTGCSFRETLSIIWDGKETENTAEVTSEVTQMANTKIDEKVQVPVITNAMGDTVTYVQNSEAEPITVTAEATDGGTLSYQWYHNNVATNGGGTKIEGATESSYIPPTDTVGMVYYYAVVTNEVNGGIQMAVSGTQCVEITEPVVTAASVKYIAHVSQVGWQFEAADGAMAGTNGEGKAIEAFKIKLENAQYPGDIQYASHIAGIGWQDMVGNDAVSGTVGEGRQIEAIKVQLTGELAENCDIYYRVYIQDAGWLGWTCNGAVAGSEGAGKRMEAMEIMVVNKGAEAPAMDSSPVYGE